MTVTCDNCGACCMEMTSPTFGEEETPPRKELLIDLDRYAYSPRHLGDCQPCIWLSLVTGRCIHYRERPQICQLFGRGGPACLAARAALGIAEPRKVPSIQETLKAAHAAGGYAWDEIEDPDAYIQDMRGD